MPRLAVTRYQVSAASRHISAPILPIESMTPGPGRQTLAERVVGVRGDVDDQVVGPLQLGDDPKYGQQEPEVSGHRRLKRQLEIHLSLDVQIQVVDGRLVSGQCLDDLVLAGQERIGGLGQILTHGGEQLDDLRLNSSIF